MLLCASLGVAQIAGTAGAFARMGFGARGIGMSNALTAVSTGEVSTYYNPAVASFSERRSAAATFSLLSFDRRLNFLSYTQALQPRGGISVGLINAGVTNIDGRDGDGVHTEDYSTFENKFYLAFSNRIEERTSIGVAVKLYYSKLFEEVKSTTVGFDIGALVQVTDELSIGAVLKDINSKYQWDTKTVYNQEGKTTTDLIPNLRRIGVVYQLPSNSGVLSVEFENSSVRTNLIRFGAEYSIVENFTVRGGLDRWDFSDRATGAKPSFGFTAKSRYNELSPAVNYAFVVEPFSPHGMHIITLSVAF